MSSGDGRVLARKVVIENMRIVERSRERLGEGGLAATGVADDVEAAHAARLRLEQQAQRELVVVVRLEAVAGESTTQVQAQRRAQAAWAVWLAHARAFGQRPADAVDHQVDFVTADVEVGREAQAVDAAMDHADAVFAHELFGAAGTVALEVGSQFAGEQQAGALDRGDHARQFARQCLQFADELGATLADVAAQLR